MENKNKVIVSSIVLLSLTNSFAYGEYSPKNDDSKQKKVESVDKYTKYLSEFAKAYVNKLLLPLEGHYYHSYEHALEVMERAMYLSKQEGLGEDDIEMMGLAGIFHDTGFIIQYDKNEPIGAKIARNYLKSILYPEKRIQEVERIILATDPDYEHPKDIYEEIIKDSDMDSLGRDDFMEKNNNIKKEIEIIKKIKIKDPEWKHASVQLLKEFKYKTNSQKYERNYKKVENLKKMIIELESEEKKKFKTKS